MEGWMSHEQRDVNNWHIKGRDYYLNSSLFWLADYYGDFFGKQVVSPMELQWASKYIVPNKPSLVKSDIHCNECFIWIESNYNRYRVRYNNGDDSYFEKYFDNLEQASYEFELLKSVTCYMELFDLLWFMGFKPE